MAIAAPAEPDWKRIETAARVGQWSEVLSGLQARYGTPPRLETAHEHYVYGSALLKLGQPGPALAYLERARVLAPLHPSIQRNWSLAREELARKLGQEARLDPGSTWLERLGDRVDLDELRGIIGLLVLTLAAFWLRAYARRRRLGLTLRKPVGILLAACLVLVLGIQGIDLAGPVPPPAALLTDVAVRSGPGESYLELGRLAAGVRVRILEVRPDVAWAQVRHEPGAVGWVPLASVLPLRPG